MPTLLAAALCAGLASATVARAALLPAALVLGLAALAGVRAPLVAVACTVALAGWWWGSVRLQALERSVLLPRVNTAAAALVEVEEPARPGPFETRVRALVVRWGQLRPHESVLLELRPGRVPPQGARLAVLGSLREPRGPSHGFDEGTWLRRHGVHVVLRADSWRIVGRRGGLGGVADRLHGWLERDAAFGLAGERRAVLEGIVLGETQGLDDGLLARFRASGLYHVLAVDGLKVAAVAGGALAFVLLLGGGRLAAELLALAATGGYVLAVGPHPAVLRAAIAAGLGSLAWLAARERDRWHALLVAAVALLAWNPYFVLDAGFQLSFAAVASIFTLAPRVARALEGYPVPHGLAQLIGVSTACGLATAPVTWLQFHQVSLVTVPANVVAVPVVAEMLGVALLTALVAPVAPPLAAALAQANGWGAAFVAACARLFGGLPGAQARSPAGVAAVAAGVLLAAAYAWRRGERVEAGLSPHRQRPAEDRAGAAPAARAHRR
ncbi:MAG: ComEC/Rec2 family competence protein [Gaiellaceae bacterium]|jgi:competence protein ComEC